MNFEELHQYVETHGTPSGPQLRSKGFAAFRNDVETATAFLDEAYPDAKISLKVRFLVISSGVPAPPLCSICGDHYVESVNERRFSLYCSPECGSIGKTEKMRQHYRENPEKRKEISQKRERTTMERYGAKSVLSLDNFRKKGEETCMTKYGAKHPAQSSEFMEERRDKFLEKYGVDNPSKVEEFKQKREDTTLARYGVKNASSSDIVKERRRDTVRERYGVDCVLESPEVREKMKDTIRERYGVESVMQNPAFVEKAKRTSMERYGATSFLSSIYRQEMLSDMSAAYGVDITSPHQVIIDPESMRILRSRDSLKDAYENKTIQELADFLGVCYTTASRALKAHEIEANIFSRSKAEFELEEYIGSLGFFVICNDRKTFGVEVDLYVPEVNLAIEFNGIYWHSSIFKTPSFHQSKSLAAHNKGAKMLHIWEDDWIAEDKKEIILAKIRAFLGYTDRVFARKTEVREVDSGTAKEFMERTHIQGYKASTVYYALYYKDVIVCMLGMTDRNGEWVIDRFSSSCSVIGGFSKLLSFFKRNNEWKEIFTYASMDYGFGDMYSTVGFASEGFTEPGLWFTDGKQRRFPRSMFMKSKLYDMFDDYEGQHVNSFLESKGIHRIHDSGSMRFRLKNPKYYKN